MNKVNYYSDILKFLDYQPQVIIEHKEKQDYDVGTNLAKALDDIHKRAAKEYYSEQLRKAQLEEVRQTAREAVAQALAEANIQVELNGDKITEAVIKQFITNNNG